MFRGLPEEGGEGSRNENPEGRISIKNFYTVKSERIGWYIS